VLLSKFLNQAPLRTLSQFKPLPNNLAEKPKLGEHASGQAVRQLLIVARDRNKLYDHVKRAFSDNPTVQVILDRRSAEPRKAIRSNAADRRRGEHQQRLETDNHLKALGWAIVRLDVFRVGGLPHPHPPRP